MDGTSCDEARIVVLSDGSKVVMIASVGRDIADAKNGVRFAEVVIVSDVVRDESLCGEDGV